MRKLLAAVLLLCGGLAFGQWNANSGPMLINNAAVTGPAFNWGGGLGTFTVVGTFAGATVTLQYLGPDGVTWVAAGANTTCTAACNGVAYLGQGQVRAAVSGGPPSGIYAQIKPVVGLTN